MKPPVDTAKKVAPLTWRHSLQTDKEVLCLSHYHFYNFCQTVSIIGGCLELAGIESGTQAAKPVQARTAEARYAQLLHSGHVEDVQVGGHACGY